MGNGIIAFKHSGFIGDIIYSLAAIKEACRRYESKANIYIWLNKAWETYDNYHDHTRKSEGLISQSMFSMLLPLLKSLPYVNDVFEWRGETVHVDLDKPKIMGKAIGLPYCNMSQQYFYAYPDLSCDLSEPTIDIEVVPQDEPYIVVNRTERWLNPHISYHFLNQYKNICFVGTITEYDLFKHHVPKAKYVLTEDALSLSRFIANAIAFVGNQSFCYAIAEQMKTPRILETCIEAPNVLPIGKNGYAFCTQEALEYYVSQLVKQ